MDRKEALEEFIKCKEMGYLKSFVPTIPAMEKAIEALQEPERKKGQWENGEPCPICGEDRFKDLYADIWADWEPSFCPNCGADMRKGEEE